MVELVLTKEQVATLRTSKDKVLLRGPNGELVGLASGQEGCVLNEAELLEEVRKDRGQPQQWYTTDEVLAFLGSLETR